MKNALMRGMRAVKPIRWLALLLIGGLGLSSQASASVEKPADREALEARVLDVRKAMRDAASGDQSNEASDQLAQWYNWPNWGNWNNWPNWRNWGNWFNR